MKPNHGLFVLTPSYSPVKGLYIASLLPHPFPGFTGGYLATPRSEPPPFNILVLRMSFVDDDSLSLAGLDAPDFLHLDVSSVSSFTAHCHSSCTTSACMKDTGRRSPKGAPPTPAIATEVCIDIHARPPILTSLPLHRIIVRFRPIIIATSSSLFHPFQQSLRSISQSSGTYLLIHPPLSTYPLPS